MRIAKTINYITLNLFDMVMRDPMEKERLLLYIASTAMVVFLFSLYAISA